MKYDIEKSKRSRLDCCICFGAGFYLSRVSRACLPSQDRDFLAFRTRFCSVLLLTFIINITLPLNLETVLQQSVVRRDYRRGETAVASSKVPRDLRPYCLLPRTTFCTAQ